jgi:hypothetical protein
LLRGATRVPEPARRWQPAWTPDLETAYPDPDALESTLDPPLREGPRPIAIRRAAQVLQRTEAEVAWLLGTSLEQSARRLIGGQARRHAFDAIVVAAVAVLAVMPVLGWRHRAEVAAKAAAAGATPRLEAVHDLQPFVPLAAGDVVARAAKTATDGDALRASVVDRYPRARIARGEIVDPTRLSQGKLATRGFSVLRIALKARPAFDVGALPVPVKVLLSAHGVPPAGVVIDAELLEISTDASSATGPVGAATGPVSATLAIANASLALAAPLLGDSDAHLARAVP